MQTISMIGSGAIGTEVLRHLQNEPGLHVASVIVPDHAVAATRSSLAQMLQPAPDVRSALDEDLHPDLLVECAGHAAIEEHVLPALLRGIPCLLASVGALATPGLPERLEQAARSGGTRLELLSGAIGGIDALAAAAIGGLEMVRYTGRKPALAWSGTPAERQYDLAALFAPATIFRGTAREAAQLYPKNANVAATVSLATLGLDATEVVLVADPAATQNVHHVEASGAFGRMEVVMQGKPLQSNPKTSALTVFSVVRAVRNRVRAVVI